MKVMGLAGTACAMTVLTGCDDSTTVPAGDGSVPLSDLKPFNGSVVWNNVVPEDPLEIRIVVHRTIWYLDHINVAGKRLDLNMFIFMIW